MDRRLFPRYELTVFPYRFGGFDSQWIRPLVVNAVELKNATSVSPTSRVIITKMSFFLNRIRVIRMITQGLRFKAVVEFKTNREKRVI